MRHGVTPVAAIIAQLFAGCTATVPEKPIVSTVEVRIPVQVPCKVTLPPVPLWELDRTSPDADLFTLAKAAAVELKQRIQYEILLTAAAKACTD